MGLNFFQGYIKHAKYMCVHYYKKTIYILSIYLKKNIPDTPESYAFDLSAKQIFNTFHC